MTLWYDVSDIVSWQLPNLTGIQRVTVGILNGLHERGVSCRLVRYDAAHQGFFAVDGRSLPASIRRHIASLEGDEAAGVATAAVIAGGGPDTTVAPPPRRRLGDRIVGTDPAARELRQALRAFKASARDLRRHAKRWVRTRLVAPPPASSEDAAAARHAPGTTAPSVAHNSANTNTTVFAPGDVLLSLGATWLQPAHAAEAGGLRRQGVHVMRMIYDLIPTLKPQWVAPAGTVAITRWVRRLLTESDHLFTISEFSKREIERYCDESGLVRPVLSVVRLGDILSGPAFDGPAPLPRFVPRRPFFVCVSTLDLRKNHRLLFDAWRMLAARDPAACPDLLCIGTVHTHAADMLREMQGDWLVNGRIHCLRGIDDRELAWYYRNCAATIYPSWYEGWGLPVAESLGQGKICLSSNATSMPEINADLPEFFEPHDTGRLVELVDRVLHDPDWRRRREAVIAESFRPTSWVDTAGQVLRVIEAHLDGARQAA